MNTRVQGAGGRVLGARCRVLGAWCWVLVSFALAGEVGAQTLGRQIDAIAAKGGVTWISYRVPMAGGPRRMCCFDSSNRQAGDCCGRCRLEQGDGVMLSSADAPAPGSRIVVEPPSDMRVFVRVENRAVVRLRTFSLDCDVDAGGMPVVPLENVSVDESVAWLMTIVRSTGGEDTVRMPALSALGLHPGNAATDALLGFARNDERPRIRSQALFWLSQRAGNEVIRTLSNAVDNDPELEVKRRAVFAISQLPRAEGVPLLIELARTHRSPEIRRQAMFWLGQSKDPRAVEFFEQVLRSK